MDDNAKHPLQTACSKSKVAAVCYSDTQQGLCAPMLEARLKALQGISMLQLL